MNSCKNYFGLIRLSLSSKSRFCTICVPKTNLESKKKFKPVTLEDADIRSENEGILDESPYYIENGLRKVYPYYYRHATTCKGRWVGRTLLDIYTSEFRLYSEEEMKRRIDRGVIRVNGRVQTSKYKVKNADLMTSVMHRHELAVLAAPIKTIYENEDLLVIDKPPSMPVHPCGLFRYNSILYLLAYETGYQNLHTIHRLDRLASGVLIFCKSLEKAQSIHGDINQRNVDKEYLCRVEGEFPDRKIICNKPIMQCKNKVGFSVVDIQGKVAMTEFQKLSFNGQSSVVRCKPYTGRTHQIRVHLQYLGHPILNDPIYNSHVFGPQKGKAGQFGKSLSQLKEDLIKEHTSEWWLGDGTDTGKNNHELSLIDSTSKVDLGHIDKHLMNRLYVKDISRLSYDGDCYFCAKGFRDPKVTNLIMFLHACKYKGENWEFQTEMPTWASEDWDVS